MGPSLGKERPSQDDSALCSCLTCTKIANVGSGDSHPSAPLRAGFFAKNAKNGAREKWNPFWWWRKRPTPTQPDRRELPAGLWWCLGMRDLSTALKGLVNESLRFAQDDRGF
jgi:hypothetical protein